MSPQPQSTIRILIVDDHSLFREGLAVLLDTESRLRVAGCAASVREALDVLAAQPIDLVLLDMELTAGRATRFVEQAAAVGYRGKILVVTGGLNREEAQHLLSQGACGIFLKHSEPELLIRGIFQCMAGEVWLDPKYVSALLVQAAFAASAEDGTRLSAREDDVLRAIFDGLSNKEISERLKISESSVKAAIQQLFDKTGVRTRGQLVRVALERYPDML